MAGGEGGDQGALREEAVEGRQEDPGAKGLPRDVR